MNKINEMYTIYSLNKNYYYNDPPFLYFIYKANKLKNRFEYTEYANKIWFNYCGRHPRYTIWSVLYDIYVNCFSHIEYF